MIEHYYRFPKHVTEKFVGDSLDKTNWDILRTDDDTPFFMIPDSKKEYDDYCATRRSYEKHASMIIDSLIEQGMSDDESICSLGIGIGILEWHILNKYSPIKLSCTDFAEEGLKKVSNFLEATEFFAFDLCSDNYAILTHFDNLLLYRMSTEFDICTWKNIFNKFYIFGCKKIVFVPTEFATLEDEKREKEAHEECIRKGEKDMFCGWLYSEEEYYDMFSAWYSVSSLKRVDNTGIFILERKEGN